GVGGGQNKELLRAPSVARIDQVAGVHVPARDNAAKGRVDVLERFQLLQAAHVGLRGSGGGALWRVIAARVVDLLFGNAVCLDQLFITRGGNARKILVGLRGAEIGARLVQLLVHFRRVDVGKQFALLHVAPDIVVPLLEVAAGTRVNR